MAQLLKATSLIWLAKPGCVQSLGPTWEKRSLLKLKTLTKTAGLLATPQCYLQPRNSLHSQEVQQELWRVLLAG